MNMIEAPQQPRIHHLAEFEELKLDQLMSLLHDIRDSQGHLCRVVVLTNRDHTARFLAARMREHDIIASAVYKNRKPRRKRAASNRFNSGRYEVLIVSSTALETETHDIYHFINYDMALPYPLNIGGRTGNKMNRRRG